MVGRDTSGDTNQPTNQSFRVCEVHLATLKVAIKQKIISKSNNKQQQIVTMTTNSNNDNK